LGGTAYDPRDDARQICQIVRERKCEVTIPQSVHQVGEKRTINAEDRRSDPYIVYCYPGSFIKGDKYFDQIKYSPSLGD
jgi:hypothetical protein